MHFKDSMSYSRWQRAFPAFLDYRTQFSILIFFRFFRFVMTPKTHLQSEIHPKTDQWRTMDAPTTNQSQAPWQPWAGQISLSTGPPQGPPCNPLHSFQNLSLGSTSDQSHSHDNRQRSRQPLTTQYHNQGYPGNHSTVASTNGTHYHTLYQASVVSHSSPSTAPQTKTTGQSTPLVLSNANQSLHISPMTPNANHRQNIPPSSLPLENQGPLPSTPQPMSPISHPFQPSHTHQGIVNGPQSLYHNDSPNTPPSAGQYVNQGPWSSPQPTCESANVGCSLPTPPPLAGGAGYNPSHLSPTPPIQQQPQWTLPPDCSGKVDLYSNTCMLHYHFVIPVIHCRI